jgi:hypothetical protein
VIADIARGNDLRRDRVDEGKQQAEFQSARQARVEGIVWRACGERMSFFSLWLALIDMSNSGSWRLLDHVNERASD